MLIPKQIGREFAPLRSLVLPLYLPCLFFATAVGAAILIIPLFAFELGGNVALSGLALGTKGAGTLIMNLPAGILVSRLGVKQLLMLSSALLVLTSLLASQINSAAALLICSFLMGATVSLWYMARLKYVSDHMPEQVWGRAMATLSCIEKGGMLLGPLVAGYLIKIFDHGSAFYLTTLLGMITLMMLSHDMGTTQPRLQTPAQGRMQLILRILLQHRRVFLSAGSVIIILLILRTARQTILPVWGLHIELDAAQIGLVIFAAGCIELLMFIPAGLILDHLGRKWSALPSFLIFSVGYTVLPLAGDFGLFIVVALIIGLGDGLSTGWGNTLISDLSTAENRGEFLAIWRVIGDTGSLSGPLIVGYLAAAISLPAASLATALCGIAGATVLALKVKETRNNKLSDTDH